MQATCCLVETEGAIITFDSIETGADIMKANALHVSQIRFFGGYSDQVHLHGSCWSKRPLFSTPVLPVFLVSAHVLLTDEQPLGMKTPNGVPHPEVSIGEVYDPYYCSGRAKKLLKAWGFWSGWDRERPGMGKSTGPWCLVYGPNLANLQVDVFLGFYEFYGRLSFF